VSLARLVKRDRLRADAQRLARIGIASAMAWWLASLLGAADPIFAVLVPLVAIKDDAFAMLNLSLARVAGVLAGVGLGAAIAHGPGLNSFTVVVVLAVGLAAGLVVRVGPEPNTQVAISALLLLVATGDPEGYALQRIAETLIGTAVCLLVVPLLWPPDPVSELRDRTRRIGGHVADDLRAAAGTLTSNDPRAARLLETATAHARSAVLATEDVPRAERALRFNLLRRSSRAELPEVTARLRLAARLAVQVRRLARDSASFAERADLRDQWDGAAAALPPILRELAEVVEPALAGRDTTAAVARIRVSLDAYRDADPRAVAAILRRPFVLLADELADEGTRNAGDAERRRALES